MAADIAEGTGTEVPPAAPAEGGIGGVVGPFGGGAEPEVPGHGFGDGRGVGWAIDALGPVFAEEATGGAVGPDVCFEDFTDGAAPDHFAESAGFFGGGALVAHLGGDALFAGVIGDLSGFPDGVGEWFFAIDVFAVVEGGHRGEGVMVVGGGDEDGIDFLHFLEHEAVVLEAFGVRPVFERAIGVAPIDVAEGDDIDLVRSGELVEVAAALAAYADGGEV